LNAQVTEEIVNWFGRTGPSKRARLRKFHAELMHSKLISRTLIITKSELSRPDEYIKRTVKFSKGFLEFINEEALEIQITELFFKQFLRWQQQYSGVEALDIDDSKLVEQGIILTDDGLTFDSKLIYSRFKTILGDEIENMNDPSKWTFNEENLELLDCINYANKNSPTFNSNLFLVKFYVLRKVDEVAYVTSRYVNCPKCGSSYAVPAHKIDNVKTYNCERMLDGKPCGQGLKNFPARKMIPTYIYEIGVEVLGKEGRRTEEFFLESFQELTAGFYTGMSFCRTENKTNSFYFTCLVARSEKGKHIFEYEPAPGQHNFFALTNSIRKHIKKVGFVIEDDKAQLPVYIETLKRITWAFHRELNIAHSLYFGAPGIGKTYSVKLLHHLFYSNSGVISGPRFTLPGLTGGQKDVFYQDNVKRKTVPGLFSAQAFLFDEINNSKFIGDDNATNLFKSVVLEHSGNSATVGGKEFARTSIIAATANYDVGHLKHYENKVKKVYTTEHKKSKSDRMKQEDFLQELTTLNQEEQNVAEIPTTFDFYAEIKDYGIEIPKPLIRAVLKIRDDDKNYLTNFAKPLMERFYFSVLVHPRYDKAFVKQKDIDVASLIGTRKSKYMQKELVAQLFSPEFDEVLMSLAQNAKVMFDIEANETLWSADTKIFLKLMGYRYPRFFAMFGRINQVHVFILYALTMINGESYLSTATKHIFERIISLLHKPIKMQDFHTPDFNNYQYIGESVGSLISIFKNHTDIQHELIDFKNPIVETNIAKLIKKKRIIKITDLRYQMIEKVGAKQ